MTRCLILGGNGFIGSHLAEGLVARGYEVTVFDSFRHGYDNISGIIDDVSIIKGDFQKESDLVEALKGADYVFHYISATSPATSFEDPVYDIESNVLASVKLFRIAAKMGAKKMVFPSSGGTIYGEAESFPIKETAPLSPIQPYAISKLAIERYLSYFNCVHNLDYLVVRYSNPFGERQSPYGKQGAIPIFLKKVQSRQMPVIYGDGTMVRDYIYIKDAVDATIALVEKKTEEKIFNVGSGEGTSLNELLRLISEVSGIEIKPEYAQASGLYISKVVLDISRVHEETGWMPKTTLAKGIRKTWDWIKDI